MTLLLKYSKTHKTAMWHVMRGEECLGEFNSIAEGKQEINCRNKFNG